MERTQKAIGELVDLVIHSADIQDARLRGISCFTGINGIDLGLQEWVRTVCYIEWDKFCQQLLLQHIREGVVDDGPVWDSLCTFDGEPWRGRVDLIFGGFPCTPHSIAGRRLGSKDSRDMWPDTIRIIRQIRPRYVFLENVAGLGQPKKKEGIPAYLGRVLGDLAESGYDAVKISLRASDVGAPHRRERVFILAYTFSKRLQGRELLPERAREWVTRQSSVGNPTIEGLPDWAGGTVEQPSPLTEFERPSGWETISEFRGVLDGFSNPLDDTSAGLVEVERIGNYTIPMRDRVRRLKALGNACVPLQAKVAFYILWNYIHREGV